MESEDFLDTSQVKTNRLIGCYPSAQEDEKSPLVIAIGGIHGNEPSGIFAIRHVLKHLSEQSIPLRGTLLGIAGNLPALEKNVRFIDEDLNRIFTERHIEAMETHSEKSTEEVEMQTILQTIEKSVRKHDPVYFIDFHSTSSSSVPYISVNEYSKSLKIAEQYPLYRVIGLEKSIPGCIAEYLNNRGFHGFTFEAGQHHDLGTLEYAISALWLFLSFTGLLNPDHFDDYQTCFDILSGTTNGNKKTYSVAEHYRIREKEEFEMKPGYVNFQEIEEGEILAKNQKKAIRSSHQGRILMPLYQKQGNDGYFILKNTG